MLSLVTDDLGHYQGVNPDHVYAIQPVLQPSQIPGHPQAQAVILLSPPNVGNPCMVYTAEGVSEVVAILNGL